MSDTPLYDSLSSDYDRFVDWAARLDYELPFIVEQCAEVSAERVLDAACGTGQHALALAALGHAVTGADISAGMIREACRNAAAKQADIRFVVAGFGALAAHTTGTFDAVLCLGNSLPHLLTADALRAALADFAAVLRPGGLLLVQNRNFDAVMAARDRWMGPQSHRETTPDGDAEWLFVRFYDFNPDDTISFNVMTLRRAGPKGGWSQHVESTTLRPLLHGELTAMLRDTGFGDIVAYGDMAGAPFDPAHSGNLIVSARRRSSALRSAGRKQESKRARSPCPR
jgi:SAM-dependent methyltransferase